MTSKSVPIHSSSDSDSSLLPLADLLRQGTAAIHEEIEHSEGAAWLARGELDREEYVRFLMMLWHVYDTLERSLEQHAFDPVLSFTYNPIVLSRGPHIAADISALLHVNHVDQSAWKDHPIHAALMAAPPSALTDYVSRLQAIADSDEPSLLLAHAYVRYLGDLSGGQVIRTRITKAYGLRDGHGVSFYVFPSLDGAEVATPSEMKRIKTWYRDNMNKSVRDNTQLRDAVVDEAKVAFKLNGGLFASLNAPQSKESTTDPALPPLGEPSTPLATDSSEKTQSGKVIYDSEKEAATYSISSVVAVVAAMSLAHFLLVIFGFTGERGTAKLEAVLAWLKGR